MVWRPSFVFRPSINSNISGETAWPIKTKFCVDCVFVMGRVGGGGGGGGGGANVHVIHFDWGGGKCLILFLNLGANVLPC